MNSYLITTAKTLTAVIDGNIQIYMELAFIAAIFMSMLVIEAVTSFYCMKLEAKIRIDGQNAALAAKDLEDSVLEKVSTIQEKHEAALIQRIENMIRIVFDYDADQDAIKDAVLEKVRDIQEENKATLIQSVSDMICAAFDDNAVERAKQDAHTESAIISQVYRVLSEQRDADIEERASVDKSRNAAESAEIDELLTKALSAILVRVDDKMRTEREEANIRRVLQEEKDAASREMEASLCRLFDEYRKSFCIKNSVDISSTFPEHRLYVDEIYGIAAPHHIDIVDSRDKINIAKRMIEQWCEPARLITNPSTAIHVSSLAPILHMGRIYIEMGDTHFNKIHYDPSICPKYANISEKSFTKENMCPIANLVVLHIQTRI